MVETFACLGVRVINHMPAFEKETSKKYKKGSDDHLRINKESIIQNRAIGMHFLLTYF